MQNNLKKCLQNSNVFISLKKTITFKTNIMATLLERLKPEFKAILNDETYDDKYGYKKETLETLSKQEFFTELKFWECMTLCYVFHKTSFNEVSQIHELFTQSKN